MQRQLPGNLVLEAAYIGNLSRTIPNGNLNINQVRAGTAGGRQHPDAPPLPAVQQRDDPPRRIGMNNYHSGMLRAEKRLSRGLSFLASYTFSRTIGNATSAQGGDFGDNQVVHGPLQPQARQGRRRARHHPPRSPSAASTICRSARAAAGFRRAAVPGARRLDHRLDHRHAERRAVYRHHADQRH